MLRQLHVADFTVAEAVYRAHQRVPVHAHEHAYLGFVIAGSCRETVGRRTLDYTPQTLIVKTPGERHSNQAGPRGTRYLLVEVGADRQLPGVFEHPRNLRGAPLGSLAMRLRQELLTGDPESELAIEALAADGHWLWITGTISNNSRAFPAFLKMAGNMTGDTFMKYSEKASWAVALSTP